MPKCELSVPTHVVLKIIKRLYDDDGLKGQDPFRSELMSDFTKKKNKGFIYFISSYKNSLSGGAPPPQIQAVYLLNIVTNKREL